MELPDSIMSKLVGHLDRQSERSTHDHRSTDRLELATCLPFAMVKDGRPGELRSVLVRNISTTGISFLTSSQIQEGDEFVIWLPDLEDRQHRVSGKVVWCQAVGRSSFTFGGSFTSITASGSPLYQPPHQSIFSDSRVTALADESVSLAAPPAAIIPD